jgi:hypothetical protein
MDTVWNINFNVGKIRGMGLELKVIWVKPPEFPAIFGSRY